MRKGPGYQVVFLQTMPLCRLAWGKALIITMWSHCLWYSGFHGSLGVFAFYVRLLNLVCSSATSKGDQQLPKAHCTLFIQLLIAVLTSKAPYDIPYPTDQCTAYAFRSFFSTNNKYLTQFSELSSEHNLINGSLGRRKAIFLKFNPYTKCLKIDLIQSFYRLPHICVK